jgi:hypothetical protein
LLFQSTLPREERQTLSGQALSCDQFIEIEQLSGEEWEEIDHWVIERPDLLESLHCTIEKVETGPEETRTIGGKPMIRPFWTKVHHLKCVDDETGVAANRA